MNSVTYGRPFDYPTTLGTSYEALTPAALTAKAKELVRPGQLVWVVVGDLRQIEAPVRALGLGEVEVRAATR